jgi:hypothetical protein
MQKLPLSRNADIVVQALGEEILIYDLKTHQAYNLNETSALVYQACDGKTTFDELKRQYKFTDDLIFLALDQLKTGGLIETDDSFVSPFSGMSRREAIRKVAFASIITLPVISSLVAPTAAMAQSSGCGGGGAGCVNSGGNCGGAVVGNCSGNVGVCATFCNNDPTYRAQCCSNTVTSGTCVPNAGTGGEDCTCVCT